MLELTFGIPAEMYDAFSALHEAQLKERELDRAFQAVVPRFLKEYLLLISGALAVAPLVGFVVARRVTRRVLRLQEAARKVGTGDLSVRVHPTGRDELDELGRAFDRMVGELADARSRLEYLQKVSAWQEVARRLAHEIKNPLTPIQLCAERLRRHFSSAPEPTRALVDECTSTIVGEVESLKGLVDEFSQFARMPAPRAVPTDLHALLDDALSLYRGLFSDVELRALFAPDLPSVSVDPEQVRRVVINLIDNAIEAMHRQGTIEVSTRHDPPNRVVRIVVADDGPGIPAAERDKLFLPYYSTKLRGSGLGLAIVRRIVAEHGGSVEVGDNTPRGTRFTIELPT
jgi:nitrogen fixation/metabolism regulation signal transduction histidine kinase